MNTPLLLFVLLLSYLIGAIPFAVLVGRLVRGIDVRRTGSGNTGAMNTFRTVGRAAGVAVALLDALKAALAMVFGRLLLGPEAARLCGAAVVAGHCFSPYLIFLARRELASGWKLALRRTGGKGLASGVAVLLLIDWRLAATAVAVFFLALKLVFKDETWPSIVAVGVTPVLVWWLSGDLTTTLAVLLVTAVVIVKHLPDVREGFYVATTNNQ